MNTLDINKFLSTPAYINLCRKIRNAEEPDNSALIRQYLNQASLVKEASLAAYRECLTLQFQLLMETIADEYLPSHWRCQCMEHIYVPLLALKRLANCSRSQQQVRRFIYELRVTSDYLNLGLQV